MLVFSLGKIIKLGFHIIIISDAVLARVESEKRLALIKAWEENEKAKADNR